MRGRRILRWIAATVLLGGSLGMAQSAGEAVVDRYKAAFLYHFTNYVTWPAAAQDSVFTIGVLGESLIQPLLVELARAKQVGDRRIVVESMTEIGQARDCQLLVVTEAYAAQAAMIDSLAGEHSVLTVTDAAAVEGVAITFVRVGDKLKFAVDRKALERADLRASAHLLKLAISER